MPEILVAALGPVMTSTSQISATAPADASALDAAASRIQAATKEAAAARPETGATINIGYIVPKDDADRVQGVITKHTEWMKGHYTTSDALISCYFTKAPLFNVPTDPSQGESDNILFTLNEEFTGPDKVAAHIESAKGNDYFPDFGKILEDYGKVLQPLGNIWFSIR